MDKVTTKKRSEIMSKVKNKDSKAEIKVRSRLHRLGYRFRLHDSKLMGKPDIVLPKYKTIIFVNGCFWHRHDCKRATIPASNIDYWNSKFERNIERFNQVQKDLTNNKWNVLTIWECQTNSSKEIDNWIKDNLKP